jgi:hypothetical protein
VPTPVPAAFTFSLVRQPTGATDAKVWLRMKKARKRLEHFLESIDVCKPTRVKELRLLCVALDRLLKGAARNTQDCEARARLEMTKGKK